MKPFFSIISTQTNHFSSEQIALGLIFVTPQKVFYKFSASKLNWLKKLDSGQGLFQITENALKKIQKATQEYNKDPYNFFQKTFSLEYFQYLNQYAAGAIAFSEPKPLNIEMNQTVFEEYFKKMIGINETVKNTSKISFNTQVKNIIKSKEVEVYADIDYSLKANKFDGILKDTKLPLITKNGSVQALEIIDFKQTENTLISHLYEAEIIYKSLFNFCKSIEVEMDKIKLAFEKPKKKNTALFDLVYKEKKEFFDFKELSEVEDFIKEVAHSGNYKKFSEVIS